MPRYRIKGPNGESLVVNAPEGATRDQVLAFARKHIETREPKEERGILRRVDDAVRGVADAATLGYSDEIAAWVADKTGLGGEKGKYDENLAAQRRRDSQGGVERLGGQVAGAIALPASKLAPAKGLKGWLGAAGEGAALGAAYESGSAKGDIGDRLKAIPRGLATGAGGSVAGRALGSTVAGAMRGKQVSKPVRLLHDEGVVMTPGRRGGAVARTYEEGILGSIPYVKMVPQAANARSIENLNVAAYNRVLKPLGQRLPMNSPTGREAVDALGETVFSNYDDAAAQLSIGMDKGIETTANKITANATAYAGPHAGQLQAAIDQTLEPLKAGPISGIWARETIQDLRGAASEFARSGTASERNVGKELWKLHDELEAALMRQNTGDVLTPFKKARESVNLFKRVEAAAAKSKDGVFSPQQLRTAVTKRGYGTTTGKVARGQAPMQDLSDAASQILPGQIPNSGSPERLAGISTLAGPAALGAFVDPTMGALTAMPLAGYAPGIDRLLQNLSLNRPDSLVRGGNLIYQGLPAFGTAGAMTALQQGQ
jgi:hypothetical protein